MKVSLRRTGGFAGLTLRSEIDASQLEPKKSAELERLVERLPADHQPRAAAAGRTMPDAFQYEVTVDDGSGPRTLRGSDGAMPDELEKLVEWLVENAE